MTDRTAQIQSLHAAYCRLTGFELPCTTARIYWWELFLSKGHGEADLEAVVNLLRRRIKQQRRRPECLKFHNLIQDIDWFEEDLAEAHRCLAMNVQIALPDGKVLEASADPEERLKLASQLRQWSRENL